MQKKIKLVKLWFLALLGAMILSSIYSADFTNENRTIVVTHEESSTLHSSGMFDLTRDFEPSSYYLSPESSLGVDDGVFFSFTANKDGNYSIYINNFPNPLTESSLLEYDTSFDNPSGSDLWYICYLESNWDNLEEAKLKLMSSENEGRSWRSQTISTFPTTTDDFFVKMTYLQGSAVAANPKTGVISIITWENWTNLMYLYSTNNGSSWSNPKKITDKNVVGATFDIDDHPQIEIAIMKNGTIFVLTETDKPNLTDITYFRSDNNGTSWSSPCNITCLEGFFLKEPEKPKMQVDLENGRFWLMWNGHDGVNQTNQYCAFSKDQTLSDSSPILPVTTNTMNGAYDFIYDNKTGQLRVIQSTGDALETWNKTTFGGLWSYKSFGKKTELEDLNGIKGYLNAYYDGIEYHYFYTYDYSGNDDLFHFFDLSNKTFWTYEDNFKENTLNQIYWDGKTNEGNQVNTSRVMVYFNAQNSTDSLFRTLYLTIDNEEPEFESYNQIRSYFNPQSANISLTDIPWEIISSEQCAAYLKVFSKQSKQKNWKQLTENNWQDSNPNIFVSNKGVLYILFTSLEAGRNILYLIKSTDKGITWSTPVMVYETPFELDWYNGAAWGDTVVVYLLDQSTTPKATHYIFRSFDEGESFEDPISLSSLPIIASKNINYFSKLVFTKNGTLFLTGKQETPSRKFFIFKSLNLGYNWTSSHSWDAASDSLFKRIKDPDIVYDVINNRLYIVMPVGNFTEVNPAYRIANYTFSTLNIETNIWSGPQNKTFQTGIQFMQKIHDPKFLLTRDNPKSPVKIKAIYLDELATVPIYKEIVSTNMGGSWSGPNLISPLNYSVFTSEIDEIYYVVKESDGYDDELFFSREGRLVYSSEDTVSSFQTSEVTFDGIDDFGAYIPGGNYSYGLVLSDDAGNEIETKGWFYADYYTPMISAYEINYTIDPIPRQTVKITVNITDELNFSADLIYKKDNGPLNITAMTLEGNGIYYGIIPGDSYTSLVQYYIRTIDLAGNQKNLDVNGLYFAYDLPNYRWDSKGLFTESDSYSSGENYEFSVEITQDVQYVDKVIIRYSLDNEESWEDLELKQHSPTFTGTLEDLPGDLRLFYYQVIILDIFGNEIEFTDVREVEFYPEIPEISASTEQMLMLAIGSALVGFVVVFAYTKLKSTSRDRLYNEIFLKEYQKKVSKEQEAPEQTAINKEEIKKAEIQKGKSSRPFSLAYISLLVISIGLFIGGAISALAAAEIGVLIIGAGLLSAILGYMFLMSRDIISNIYLEKIKFKTIVIEMFQIVLLFAFISAILLVGYTIDWFRYYLIETTYTIGTYAIPALFISVIAVFFTSLVLVAVTTYITLRKTVHNIKFQREQGASDSLLLYLKDQNSSEMVTKLGYKTIVFLITILITVLTTTNLISYDLIVLLAIVIGPFAVACILALLFNRSIEKRRVKKKKHNIQMPFSDSTKICNKCGNKTFLSDKHCSTCGEKLIHANLIGTYVARCKECKSLINDKAIFCPTCGKNVSEDLPKES